MKQKTNNENINKTKISLFNKTYKALIRLMTKKKKREREWIVINYQEWKGHDSWFSKPEEQIMAQGPTPDAAYYYK